LNAFLAKSVEGGLLFLSEDKSVRKNQRKMLSRISFPPSKIPDQRNLMVAMLTGDDITLPQRSRSNLLGWEGVAGSAFGYMLPKFIKKNLPSAIKYIGDQLYKSEGGSTTSKLQLDPDRIKSFLGQANYSWGQVNSWYQYSMRKKLSKNRGPFGQPHPGPGSLQPASLEAIGGGESEKPRRGPAETTLITAVASAEAAAASAFMDIFDKTISNKEFKKNDLNRYEYQVSTASRTLSGAAMQMGEISKEAARAKDTAFHLAIEAIGSFTGASFIEGTIKNIALKYFEEKGTYILKDSAGKSAESIRDEIRVNFHSEVDRMHLYWKKRANKMNREIPLDKILNRFTEATQTLKSGFVLGE